nr:hypothetical protein [Tanacetum cinerariifolium]
GTGGIVLEVSGLSSSRLSSPVIVFGSSYSEFSKGSDATYKSLWCGSSTPCYG